jgi:diguanylate cyclase (GGDEF)-like protein
VERLDAAMAAWNQGGDGCAVVCFDIDRFDAINDTLGHDFGDDLLRAVGTRLRTMLRPGDLLGRLGGDEFAALMVAPDAGSRAEALAEQAVLGVSRPYQIGEHRLIVPLSAGVAIPGGRGDDARAVLKRADTALFRAKHQGGNGWASFTPRMLAGLRSRQRLEVELWEAYERDEFEIWYQPQVDLRDGTVVGVEALLRWPHRERGLVSPDEFIPIASAVGLIRLLGERVLERACTEVANWPVPIRLAVNVATVQLAGGDLVEAVKRVLSRSRLPAERLELEITESVFIQKSRMTDSTLDKIRALGVHFSLDDFGTGYSSLAYLQKFPIDKIKIDRTFISGIPDNQGATSIVRAVAAIAKSLGIRLNAEGIENVDQVAFLRLIGCQEGQGYLYGKAAPASEIVALLSRSLDATRDRIA